MTVTVADQKDPSAGQRGDQPGRGRADGLPNRLVPNDPDAMVDEWGRQSFPASDPPSNW